MQVIDAEMERRRLLEESPIPSTNEEPVLFDTAEIPWWAWVRRFHLPEVRPAAWMSHRSCSTIHGGQASTSGLHLQEVYHLSFGGSKHLAGLSRHPVAWADSSVRMSAGGEAERTGGNGGLRARPGG